MPEGNCVVKELTLPSQLESLEVADAAAVECAELAGFDEREAGEVATAVIEAVTNAVVHGNCCSDDKCVALRFRCEPGLIKIEVGDCGDGFDLSCVHDPTDPEWCMSCSGRGIFIMRAIMDSVEFEISPEAGTTVTMVKRLEAPPSGSAAA
jgi:serine/threonine-protein kinase RsbW